MELKERINKYLLMDDQLELVGLIEDELEVIIARIFSYSCHLLHDEMTGNATLIKKTRNGYLAQDDDEKRFFIPQSSYKGRSEEKGTRLQCNKFKVNKGRTIAYDAMECVSYEELRYRLFTSIEDGNMILAATTAWAIYKEAKKEDQDEMRICIHALRNYYRQLSKLTA